jgi:hypothetical protein
MSSYKQTCVRSSINTGSDFISLIYFGESVFKETSTM